MLERIRTGGEPQRSPTLNAGKSGRQGVPRRRVGVAAMVPGGGRREEAYDDCITNHAEAPQRSPAANAGKRDLKAWIDIYVDTPQQSPAVSAGENPDLPEALDGCLAAIEPDAERREEPASRSHVSHVECWPQRSRR